MAELEKCHIEQYDPELWRSHHGMYRSAPSFNAIDMIRCEKVAMSYLDKPRTVRPSIGNHSGLAEVLRQMKSLVPAHLHARVEMQKVNKVDLPQFEEGPYTWLVSQKWCFVLHLNMAGKVDEIVCVNGYRSLVLDDEGNYVVVSNEDTL